MSKRGATYDRLTMMVGHVAIRRFDLVSEHLTGYRSWVSLDLPPEAGALCYNDDSPLVAEGDRRGEG
ncbi:hypothetical protein YTPLAS72_10730 [Nitrospira sp.]|nr:hypothetical protein YTPLAS72_10730 [Nitrospira sp.]